MVFSGRHKTLIGDREGLKLIGEILSHKAVKRVIFGRIENKGSRTGHGLRFKITRIDERGNIRAILSYGSSNQEIHIITTASGKEEGLKIAQELSDLFEK
ncbi:MAG: DUF2103 domain-containing protein [Archaeoglobaceae archaeon]|nr:DUF2103 domain-containing protein [Archaeoglobaceae archaeon]MDW8118188.1 DUF2103 domain-containing protein [Archaeoglobaceae archaeon]